MSDVATLEERVAKLEFEIAEIKRNSSTKPQGHSWVDDVSGSMKDVPNWSEIVKLGREVAEGRLPPN